MKIQWNEKYNTVSAYVILTFTICLIIALAVGNISVLGGWVGSFFSVISPIIWGAGIAYLLNPIMMWAEKALAKLTNRKKPHPKLNRVLAVIIAVLALLLALTAVILIIIPQVYESVMSIAANFETYMRNFEAWINDILENYPDILSFFDERFEEIRTAASKAINDFLPKIGDLIVTIKDGAVSVVGTLSDFIIGIIVSVYLLLDKERFLAQSRKTVSALLRKKQAEGFFRICSLTNRSLSGFISGKIIDSIIIGVLCFICMTLIHFDYSLLISVIIGITNIIPVFGPIFGAIPCALLLLISSPKQVIPFVILIIVIQQLDGNVIGPKILGNSTGLSAFWVLFAILVGGGLFGFGGMLLGVPVFAGLSSLSEECIAFLLKKKGMSAETADYVPLPKKKPIPADEKNQMKSFRLWKKNGGTPALPEKKEKSSDEKK